MTFTSSLDLIGIWRVSRFPLWRFVPLSVLLGGAAWAGGSPSPVQFAAAVVLALMLTAQFRLWDDLADRARDRREHPRRVVVTAASLTPFVHAIVVMGALNVLGLGWSNGGAAAAGLIGLVALLALWYRVHHGRGLVHTHILLLKYPGFVALLAIPPGNSAGLALAAAVVYAAMCACELLDDPKNSTRAGGIALAAHCGFLALGPVIATLDRWSFAATLTLLAAHVATWRQWRHSGTAGALCYLPFAAAALILCFIALRGTS